MGYDLNFVIKGAGIYQLYSDTSSLEYCFSGSICDEPKDTYFIENGAIAYDRENIEK